MPMKTLFSIALCIGILCHIDAQMIGVSLGPQVPLGGTADFYQAGFGGSVFMMYPLSEQVSVGGTIGYYTVPGLKNSFHEDWKLSWIPISGVVQYYFITGTVKPYVGLDLGIYAVNEYIDVDESYNGTNIGLAPSLGAVMTLTDKVLGKAEVKYNAVFDDEYPYPYLGINAGLIISLN